jgi:hypothetical protein
MSEKSIADKLRIKPGVALWTPDDARLDLLGPLPEAVTRVDEPRDAAMAILFVDAAASLHEILAVHGDAIATVGTVWVAYPKGNRTDINRDSLWPMLAELSLRPNGQVAIDDTWSALRFRPLRAGEAQFTGGNPRV